ncbi:MAG: UDP-N-acetylglucosamine 2-epimerase [Promethearchaeota archaeon]
MKKVAYISGNRADFNLMLKPLLELKKYVDLMIIATGMHFSDKWGTTIKEIEKYTFKMRKADVNLQSGSLSNMTEALGLEIIKITKNIEDFRPDLILVEGDRGEALAGAIIGAHLNIPVVHHGGGDLSDSIDNKIRFAITMFSDFHLTGNLESYNRLIKMGIPKSNIFNVGEPGLDDIIAGNYTQKEEIRKKYGIDPNKPLLILIFHPNTKEFTSVENQILEIMEAIKDLKIPTIGLYANADAGGNVINKFLEEYQNKLPFLKLYKHFFRKDFYGLLGVCSGMLGNSSAGITELVSFKKPFICIGTRQKGRLKAENVIEVNYNKNEIINAVKKGLYDNKFKKKLENVKNPYGNGNSYLKITDIILKILRD